MLADNLSIIQCHILFDDDRGKSRLEHQKSWKGIPSFGKIFEDCDFFGKAQKSVQAHRQCLWFGFDCGFIFGVLIGILLPVKKNKFEKST